MHCQTSLIKRNLKLAKLFKTCSPIFTSVLPKCSGMHSTQAPVSLHFPIYGKLVTKCSQAFPSLCLCPSWCAPTVLWITERKRRYPQQLNLSWSLPCFNQWQWHKRDPRERVQGMETWVWVLGTHAKSRAITLESGHRKGQIQRDLRQKWQKHRAPVFFLWVLFVCLFVFSLGFKKYMKSHVV